MTGPRVLGIAAATGRVGYVLLVNGRPYHWRISEKAAERPEEAARMAKDWIDRLRPDVVVTERITGTCRKGERAKACIKAIADVAAAADCYDIAVMRTRNHPNKYAEAEALAERFPALRPWVPSRKVWEGEPHNTTIFEALVLALVVVDREPSKG